MAAAFRLARPSHNHSRHRTDGLERPEGVALGYSIRSLLLMPLQLYLIWRVSGIGIRDHIDALAKPVLASAAMGLSAALLFYMVNPAGLVMIALICIIAAAVYVALVATFLPQYRRRVLELASL